MSEVSPLQTALPAAAKAAVDIVHRLRDAGHEALLNGGCVRDLLLGLDPKDYDVATNASPDRVCGLFRPTRKVGAQFGVVLVRQRRAWIEVATFRQDWDYADGRRPTGVTFSDARTDAQRRDFTVNGMFLDPIAMQVIDYVGGRADLQAGLIRAIGEPAQRFAEDYLRLLRAVRFAARLGFAIEPRTLAAIREHADRLPNVATERRREELEKMLAHPMRGRALELLQESNLLSHLWDGAGWEPADFEQRRSTIAQLPKDAAFELAIAILLAGRSWAEIEAICRGLAFSNEQRETVLWLTSHRSDLDAPADISLANLKHLLADPAFAQLRMWAELRFANSPNTAERHTELATRIDAIPPDAIAPAPLVTGDDLAERSVPPGPIYKRVLDELYTRQLNDELTTREEALSVMEKLLAVERPD